MFCGEKLDFSRGKVGFSFPNVSQLHRILTGFFWGVVSVARLQRSVRAISGPPSGHKSKQASPRCASTLQQMARLIFANEKACLSMVFNFFDNGHAERKNIGL